MTNNIPNFNIPKRIHQTKQQLAIWMRKTIISTAWKVFHILLQGNNNLYKTAQNFSKNYNVEIDEVSKQSIQELQKNQKWVIISNHQNMNFSDYLPLFEQLWEDILEKTVFYTWEWNLNMNESLFENNDFRQATFRNITDWKNIVNQLQVDLEKIENQWWYIFIIPTGASREEKFQWLFKRIVEHKQNLPLLHSKVKSHQDLWYKDIVENIFQNNNSRIDVTTRLSDTSQLHGLSGQEMFAFSHELLDISKN